MAFSVAGIDPGLVHTGIVQIIFNKGSLSSKPGIFVHPTLVTSRGCLDKAISNTRADHCFIEQYRPRAHFKTDSGMIALVNEIRALCQASNNIVNVEVISNTGSKAVIRKELLKRLMLLKLGNSHHQDLEAAARIAIWGMLKNSSLNRELATFVTNIGPKLPVILTSTVRY